MTGGTIAVTIAEIATVTPAVRRLTLVPAIGTRLPAFSSGSHVLVSIGTGDRKFRNAYSLIGRPGTRDHYQIAVRRLESSRGGSRFLHDAAAEGDVLEIEPPANLFPLAVTGCKHLLIAGGIGITPILSHLPQLSWMNAHFELHFAVRDLAEGPFAEDLLRRYPSQCRLYQSRRGERLDVPTLLRDQPLGTHLYVCGPAGLIADTVAAASRLGWPERYVHVERFAGATPGRLFTAILARSGREISVAGDESLLEAIEAAGIEVPCLCRGGACGHCETGILGGEAEHRDYFLSDAVKAGQTRMMPCVSRAKTDRIVLDL